VVGGVAALALIATAAWFLLRRRSTNHHPPGRGGAVPVGDDPPPGYGYYSSEAKGPGQVIATPSPGNGRGGGKGPSELQSEREYVELGPGTAYVPYSPGAHGGQQGQGYGHGQGLMQAYEMDATPGRYRDEGV
jgi:hypothetical protein